MWERYVLNRHRHYNPDLDKKAKIDELRAKYETSITSEKIDDDDSESVSGNVSRYFELEKQHSRSTEETRGGGAEKTEEKLATE